MRIVWGLGVLFLVGCATANGADVVTKRPAAPTIPAPQGFSCLLLTPPDGKGGPRIQCAWTVQPGRVYEVAGVATFDSGGRWTSYTFAVDATSVPAVLAIEAPDKDPTATLHSVAVRARLKDPRAQFGRLVVCQIEAEKGCR